MNWLGIIFIIACLLIFLILVSNIKIEVKYQYDDKVNSLCIIVTLFLIIHYRHTLDFNKRTKNTEKKTIKKEQKTNKEVNSGVDSFIASIETQLRLFQSIFKGILYFFKKVKIQKFALDSDIGGEDAPKTAQLYGAYWGLLSVISVFLSQMFTLSCPLQVNICPNFNCKKFTINFCGIFQFKIGNLILAGLKFITGWKGKKKFFIIPVISEH